MCPADTYLASPGDAPFGEPILEHDRANIRKAAYGEKIRDPKNLRNDYGAAKSGGIV